MVGQLFAELLLNLLLVMGGGGKRLELVLDGLDFRLGGSECERIGSFSDFSDKIERNFVQQELLKHE